jgi:hypothetical protein
MQLTFFFLLLCYTFAIRRVYPPLNSTTVKRVSEAILDSFSLPVTGTYGVYCNPCANGDAVGALVRLPFHDAVGGGRPNSKGGANGCIDWSFAGNNGLQEVTTTLNNTYMSGGFSELLSRADFWVLAGNTAVLIASTLPSGKIPEGGLPIPQSALELPFRYGREDDASCNGVDAAFLPAVQMGYAGTAAIFTTRIGMTPKQLVAVMGAHTLGRAQGQDSGFDGSWSGYSSSFSIAYYWQLLGVQWNNKDQPPGSWIAPSPVEGGPMLINLQSADVELVITPSDSCSFFNELNFTQPTPAPNPPSSCPLNKLNTATLKEFTGNQTAWWVSFSEAWTLMTEYSYADLKPVL